MLSAGLCYSWWDIFVEKLNNSTVFMNHSTVPSALTVWQYLLIWNEKNYVQREMKLKLIACFICLYKNIEKVQDIIFCMIFYLGKNLKTWGWQHCLSMSTSYCKNDLEGIVVILTLTVSEIWQRCSNVSDYLSICW